MINLINAVPFMYRWGAIALLAASLFGFGWLKGAQHAELEAAKFEAATEALGKAQVQQTKLINDRNIKLKQEADNAYTKAENDLTALYAEYRRLRLGSGSRTVSSLPTNASDPERICFNRAKFADAMGTLENEIPGILEQGDRGITGLNIAKDWAQKK